MCDVFMNWGLETGLQLQFRPCSDIANATVTALGGLPRELVNHRGRLQWQFLILSGVAPANQTKKRAKTKVNDSFRPFLCEFWCFSLGKQARFTLNFCSGMPLWKVHELTFLWFGLPRPQFLIWWNESTIAVTVLGLSGINLEIITLPMLSETI